MMSLSLKSFHGRFFSFINIYFHYEKYMAVTDIMYFLISDVIS